MKRPKIKVTQLLVLMTLCCALLAGNLFIPGAVAEAATKKTAISTTAMTIPVGKMDSKVYWYKNTWDFGNAQKLTVKNTVKGATYQFTSSDTKVVKISKTGGYLTGLKAGSATITLTQTYKNKKTTIGKCKVTVKKATLNTSDYGNEFAVGDGVFDISYYFAAADPLYSIAYRNPNATYTLTPDSKDFTIKEVKYDASTVKEITDNKEFQDLYKEFIGTGYLYGYKFTAKAAGTYTVTVKETYNKTTKTLGSFKVIIKDTSIAEPKVDLLLGNYLNVFNLINYARADKHYYFKIAGYDETNPDNNVLGLVQNDNVIYLYAVKTGTAEVTISEETEQGPVIGTVTVTVSEAPCQDISVDSEEYTTYVGEEYFSIYYNLEPWDTTDKVTVESDKPDVLKVEYSQEEEEWIYTPLKAGEASVTIKCGSKSVTVKVIVEEEW